MVLCQRTVRGRVEAGMPFACIVLLLILPNHSFSHSVADLLKAGDEHFVRCDNTGALREYESAYRLAPDDMQVLLRLVRVYNDQGRLALRRDTTSEMLYLKAVAFAETLRVYYPNQAATHFWLALSYGSLIPFRGVSEKIRLGRVIRSHAEEALKLDSTFALAYVVLAIFEREGANLSWFEKTIVRVVFGEDLRGSLAESERLLHCAVRLEPDNSFAWYELYWTYHAMKNDEQARAALRQVLAIPPQSAREELQQREARSLLERGTITATKGP